MGGSMQGLGGERDYLEKLDEDGRVTLKYTFLNNYLDGLYGLNLSEHRDVRRALVSRETQV